MTRTTYVCDGCGAELRNRRDLSHEPGHVRSSYTCEYCGTTVPSVTAEKIKHQAQHGTGSRRPPS